ncbi:MAG: PaaI family thioesterase [Rhizobacter sp.]
MTEIADGVADGFGPIFRSSPTLDALGGFMSRGSGASLEIALLVGATHLNSHGTLHGGVAATLADTGTGYLLAFATAPPRRMVTISLTVDYLSPAQLGELVQVVVDGSDLGGRTVFASGRLVVGARTVARIRVMFALTAVEARAAVRQTD